MQPHRQAAVRLLLDELVGAAVPDLDRPGAVLALRDLALESGVLERVVLHVDGEVLLARLQRNTLRHGPGRERAVPLEPEVVVQPPRVVALDDEDGLCLSPRAAAGEGLGCPLGIPFPAVLVEAHRWKLCLWPRLGIGSALRTLVVSGQASIAEAFPQAGGPTLEAGFTGLESYSGRGKTLWILGIADWKTFPQAKTPRLRKRARLRRFSSSPPLPSRSSSASRIDSPSSLAASSWSV